MRCPRCHGECEASAASCPACQAPLLIGDDPAPAPLDRKLDLGGAWFDRPDASSASRARRSFTPHRPISGPVTGWQLGSLPPSVGDDPPLALGAPGVPAGAPAAPAWAIQPEDMDPGAAAAEPADEVGADGVVDEPSAPEQAGVADGASFWRRIAADVLDAAVVALAAAPPLALASRALAPGGDVLDALLPAGAGLLLLLAFTYAVLGHALMGATAGKRLMGLRVTLLDGTRPGLGRSVARVAVALAGIAALGVGVLAALFTRSGRGLHDLVAGTRVVRAP